MSVTRGFIKYTDLASTVYYNNKSRPSPQSNVLLRKATIEYTKLIEKIQPNFKKELLFIPRRTLTNPREPSKNDGHDNINDDYILVVNNVLVGIENEYIVLDLMGQGTFGQVAKCRVKGTDRLVAVKIIKRQPAFLYQGEKEIQVLLKLKSHPEEKEHFLQMLDFFNYKGHTCSVLELLSISLHKLLFQSEDRIKLTIHDIQKISFHILKTLALLKENGIIHTDLKPDNILLKSLDDIHNVKLIDYGSALMESEPLNYCVQTAFYRSPEVILHVPFNCAIDMWSFGCFVAEMFLGRPLFPSGDELTLLHMMTKLLGSLPSDHMLKQGRRTGEFFMFKSGTETKLRERVCNPHDSTISKSTLEEKIMGFRSYDDDDSIIDNHKEMLERECLLDFLRKILVFDPDIRLSPKEALQHPFITSKEIILPTNIDNNRSSSVSVSGTSPSINTSRTEDDSSGEEIKTPLIHLVNCNSKENLLLSPNKPLLNASPLKSPLQSPLKPAIKSPLKLPLKSAIKSPIKSPIKSSLKSPSKSPIKSPIKSPSINVTSPQTKVLKSILKKQPVIPDYQPAIQVEDTLGSRMAVYLQQQQQQQPVPKRPGSNLPLNTMADYYAREQQKQKMLRDTITANSSLMHFYQNPFVTNMTYAVDPNQQQTQQPRILKSPLLYQTQPYLNRQNTQFNRM